MTVISKNLDFRIFTVKSKEVCNRAVTSASLRPGSLDKTVRALWFAPWFELFVEKMVSIIILLKDSLCHFFNKKKTKKDYSAILILRSFATFLV